MRMNRIPFSFNAHTHTDCCNRFCQPLALQEHLKINKVYYKRRRQSKERERVQYSKYCNFHWYFQMSVEWEIEREQAGVGVSVFVLNMIRCLNMIRWSWLFGAFYPNMNGIRFVKHMQIVVRVEVEATDSGEEKSQTASIISTTSSQTTFPERIHFFLLLSILFMIVCVSYSLSSCFHYASDVFGFYSFFAFFAALSPLTYLNILCFISSCGNP